MAAPCDFAFLSIAFLAVYCLDVVICIDFTSIEKEESVMGLSIVGDTKRVALYDDDTGECPDPDLIAAFHAKYTSRTEYNTTTCFMERVLGPQLFNKSSLAMCPFDKYELMKLQSKSPKPRVPCIPVERGVNETLQVKLVNSSSLLQSLGHKNGSVPHCTVVLFFAPWCMFCAQMAPHYNALARAFPELNVLAIDAVYFSSLNTRYGTVAVPNLLVFYNDSKAIAKYNHTERNLENLSSFVSNVTGFKPDPTVHVTTADYEGPLSSKPSSDRDWLLWLAWTFVIIFSTTMFAKSVLGHAMYTRIISFWKEIRNTDNGH